MSDDFKNVSWPGWETVRLIGRGSFGAVYEIERKVFEDTEKAALKVISIPQSTGDIDEMYSDGYDEESITSTFKSHLQSIVAEYSLMRKLNGCANIVNCDDVRYVQHDDGIGWDIFIKMELLTPLAKSLPAEVPEETVIKIARDMCGALELCKKHGIVHRDIKPQNIFVSEHGDYKLGDFGIAKTVEKTMGGTKIGTYKYMAPEVYNNQPYGSGADIYSLGLVLYWLLNERRMPFMPLPPEKLKAGTEESSRNRRFAGEKLPEPAHGSKKLKQIVLKACAYDPKDRYQTATELLRDIENPSQELPVVDGPVPPTPEPPTPEPPAPEPPAPEPPTPKKKNKLLVIFAGMAVVVVIIILLLLRSCDGNAAEVPSSVTTGVHKQLDWSDWADTLPQNVAADQYEIEEKTVYSSRTQETTSSTEKKNMAGWELFDVVEADGAFGPWSDWSEDKVEDLPNRQIEPQTRYRYRDKETTTGSSPNMNGWTKFDTTYSYGDYGSWSSWSTDSETNSESRKVESKTQYRYRNISYSTEYTNWGSWGSWSSDRQSTSDLKKEDSRTVYGYYYFRCPGCGAHMHGWNMYCPTWAGGCGKTWIPESTWKQIYSTTSWNSAGLKDWYGTGKYYTYIDGQLVFKWTGGGTVTQYRYATRSTQQVANYGSWSSWGDTAYYNSSTREVQTRTVYRYCDRSQVPTYHFYRWGNWSDWSENKVSGNNDRQVENKTFYRYRDQVKTKTYYFRRWTDWSAYSDSIITPSDTVEVQTKTQYRYKSKGN